MQASPELRIYLLDSPHIEYRTPDQAITSLEIPRLQTRALFYRLAVSLKPVARDHLSYLFWPDASDATARRNLTILLSHLRRALPLPHLLIANPESVQLDTTYVWSDSAQFAHLCAEAQPGQQLNNLRNAIALYHGPLLNGFAPPQDAAEYDLWLTTERHSFENMALTALTTLIEALAARGNTGAAIPYAQRYLEIDPLAEDVHRLLMHNYALAGDSSAARRQFERCVAALEQGLGVKPLPETYAVYQAILKDEITTPPRAIKEAHWTTLPGPQVALTGREQAWQQMLHFYEQAADESGSIVLLAGEAGIGKSRLIQEFATNLPGTITVLQAASHPGVQSIPYEPLIQALRPTLWQHPNLNDVPTSWLSIASLLWPELHSRFPHLPAPALLDPEQARGQVFEALCRLLLTLCRDAVVLLCLDDLHWADATTLDWLSYAARYLRHSRLLIVGALRSEESGALSTLRLQLNRLRVLHEIELPPLDIHSVQQVLSQFDPQQPELQQLSARLLKITGGNPFFLLECIQTLFELGGALTALEGRETLPISATVRETIGQRMDRLPPLARQILEAGAVLGPVFDFDLLRQVAGRQFMETGNGLDELIARRFVEVQGKQYRFYHELIQAVVYQSLSLWRRQLLHKRAAETLETMHPNVLGSHSGRIAEHYARANLPAQAIPFYQRAAEVAERVYATKESLEYLRKALELSQSLPDRAAQIDRELTLHIDLGAALTALEGWSAPEIRQNYMQALALCEKSPEREPPFPIILGLQVYYQVQGEFVQAGALGEQLLRIGESSEDARLRNFAYNQVGALRLHQGNFPEARRYLEASIATALRLPNHPTNIRPNHGMLTYCFLAHTLWHLGYPDQAITAGRAAVTLATESAPPYDQAVALTYLATLYQFCRDTGMVQELAADAMALAQEYGYAYYLAWSRMLLGWVAVERGEVARGIQEITDGLAAFDMTGAGLRKPYYLRLLAEAHGRAGEIARACALIDEAVALIARRGERWSLAEQHRVRGELLLAQDATGASAEPHFSHALEIARSQHAMSMELRATLSLCRMWVAQGKSPTARAALAQVYDRFSEGFATPDLVEARALLQTLGV